jgi:5-methyltetrahydrofolate--homocysteine methyltransferase
VDGDRDGDGDDRQRRRRVVLAEMQRGYADAVLADDEVEAERIVRDAIEAGIGEADIDEGIITPVLRLVGDLGAGGSLPLDEVTRATRISLRVLALQREAFRAAHRRGSGRIVLARPRGEQHGLGLEMAESVLAHSGYDVHLLDSDVPDDQLAACVDQVRPVVLGLTVTMPEIAARLPVTIAAVREASPGLGVVVGGQGASERLCSVPGVVVCRHVTDAVELTDALLHRAALN